MERDCFAFKETKHNHCSCLILEELVCKGLSQCAFYKHRNEINSKEIEKEIVDYAKEKKKENRVGTRKIL